MQDKDQPKHETTEEMQEMAVPPVSRDQQRRNQQDIADGNQDIKRHPASIPRHINGMRLAQERIEPSCPGSGLRPNDQLDAQIQRSEQGQQFQPSLEQSLLNAKVAASILAQVNACDQEAGDENERRGNESQISVEFPSSGHE